MSKKIKFNILDFCIVLFAILIILSAFFWKDIRSKFTFDEKNAEYSFVVTGLTKEAAEAVSAGNNLYFSEDGTFAGKIESVSAEREIRSVSLIDGDKVEYESDFYTLRCKVDVKGKEMENGFYIDDRFFTVPGKKFSLETDSVKLYVEITSINY